MHPKSTTFPDFKNISVKATTLSSLHTVFPINPLASIVALCYSHSSHKRFFKKKFNHAETHHWLPVAFGILHYGRPGPGFESWPFLSDLTLAAHSALLPQPRVSFRSEETARAYHFTDSSFPGLHQLTLEQSRLRCHLVPGPFLTTLFINFYQISPCNLLSSLSEISLFVGLLFKLFILFQQM